MIIQIYDDATRIWPYIRNQQHECNLVDQIVEYEVHDTDFTVLIKSSLQPR